jgi:uncharacterized protein YsxB (DUF464 family)
MIKVYICRNSSGQAFGFKVENHGDPIVCSAVSALCFNTVNSIEQFTELDFSVDASQDGGDMTFTVPFLEDGGKDNNASLLIDSLILGLKQIELDYSKDLKVLD